MSAPTSSVVGSVTDLTVGEGRTYVVNGQQVAVFLLGDGTLRALGARCPHRGGPIADGQTDATKVMCPLHQYTFSFTDGACTNGDIEPLPVFKAELHDGRIHLWV
ncbi:Rieske (2Fe-2S) protein [Williamsia sp. 1135]|uniref:Rieske (2Fe-2S) protein n=1 Tax=Williamsia sp. 1135 TaxID=1889262 RepID=UPI000A0F83E0|nr:Rieske (2Fe-2S) protein [Williamsia sp. 1135]ORM24142.1 2Fe-2S ferredoxin [Williamsia sp. 1135]